MRRFQFYKILVDILKILLVFLSGKLQVVSSDFYMVVLGGEGWTKFRWLQRMVGSVFMDLFLCVYNKVF